MSKNSFPEKLNVELNRLKEKHLFRELSIDLSGLDFYSNDYLGFGKIIRPARETFSGSGGSRLISGNYESLESLELKIARFHSSESALVFPSGFQANIGLYRAIARKDDTLLYDEHVHASIRDGMQLSYASKIMFKHNDLAHLEKNLKSAQGEKYIVVESLYSMHGDLAPLEDMAELCEKYSAYLIVDEAHSNGIFGKRGEGLVSSDKVLGSCIARIYGYGKAFACQGAAIVGSKQLKSLLINKHRAFIFSTGVSPMITEAISDAYDKIHESNSLREKLFANISCFNNLFYDFEGNVVESPIKSIPFSGNENVMKLASDLRKQGFLVKGIRSPTVPVGEERIRVILHAFNSFEEIESLFEAVSLVIRK